MTEDDETPCPFPLYDKQGELIPTTEAFARLADDMKYVRVAETYVTRLLPWPNATVWISTVWLRGVDHGSIDGKPLIFETMLWPRPSERFPEWNQQVFGRYSTEEQALEGHQEAVAEVREYFGWSLVAHSARALYALFALCVVGVLLGLVLLYWLWAGLTN